MDRLLRIKYEGVFYHVTSRERHHSDVFDDDESCLPFLKILTYVVSQAGWVRHGCDLMSSYQSLAGDVTPPDLLSVGMIKSQLFRQKNKAKQLYADFVAQEVGKESIWSNLRQQLNPVQPLHAIANAHKSRDDSIVEAYQSGAYSYSPIADYVNVHFTTVG